jgi:hypothetical protein
LVKRAVFLLALCAGCTGGTVSETLNPTSFDAVLVEAPVPLKASPSFADERGGGVFVDPTGLVVRLRADGSVGRLESHPGNSTAAGAASAVWPLGPYTALAATDRGLYVAESGWLIQPTWRDALTPEGLKATALGDNGVAWIAHESGLFRIEDGALSELKDGSASITGITGLAVAPSLSGASAIWFAQGEKLSWAEQTSKTAFNIGDSTLSADSVKGGITALAGLSAAPGSKGELWAITNKVLWRHDEGGWHPYELGRAPKELVSSGRVLWLRAGDGLFRYDADAKTWTEAKGLAAVPTLLAADATGAAWVRVAEKTIAVSPQVTARVQGLFQSARVYASELLLNASVPVSSMPEQMAFTLDDGPETVVLAADANPGDGAAASQLFFSLGGVDASGRDKPYSLAGLMDGLHTLKVVTKFAGGSSTRLLHWDFRGGSNVQLSYATDIKPIQLSRCDKCHTKGPGQVMSTYDDWVLQKEAITKAVGEQRMPADGLLDPASIQKIQRWVAAGAKP